MRRFPDLSGLVARAVLTASLACLGATAMWLARASGEALPTPLTPARGATAPTTETTPPAAPLHVAPEAEVDVDELIAAGRLVWEEWVPAEIRARYEIPSMDQVRALLARFEAELESGSVEELAAYESQARLALKFLRRHEGGDLLAAWLEPRLDMIKAASQIAATPPARWPEVLPALAATPPMPGGTSDTVAPAPLLPPAETVRPQFTRDYWDRVLARRPAPSRAEAMIPRLKEIFAEAGVPPELVWIAEVESSMNPEAISPVGARGLFQFMPLTAARFGLQTGVLLDERTDPEKSAWAAATYLRVLHRRFRSWPLALAAYNAGEGRVGRLLAREKASSFEAVAHRLPSETRMYVPKVFATVAVREGIDPEALPAPTASIAAARVPPRPVAADMAPPARVNPAGGTPGPMPVGGTMVPVSVDVSGPTGLTTAPASL